MSPGFIAPLFGSSLQNTLSNSDVYSLLIFLTLHSFLKKDPQDPSLFRRLLSSSRKNASLLFRSYRTPLVGSERLPRGSSRLLLAKVIPAACTLRETTGNTSIMSRERGNETPRRQNISASPCKSSSSQIRVLLFRSKREGKQGGHL